MTSGVDCADPRCPMAGGGLIVMASGFGGSIDGRHPPGPDVRSALTIRPLLQHSRRISGFPGMPWALAHQVAVHCTAHHLALARSQVPRTPWEAPLVTWPKVPTPAAPPSPCPASTSQPPSGTPVPAFADRVDQLFLADRGDHRPGIMAVLQPTHWRANQLRFSTIQSPAVSCPIGRQNSWADRSPGPTLRALL